MLTIRDEIFMAEKSIKKLEEELDSVDITNPNNRFKYANLKSELVVLSQKLDKLNLELQEEYKNGKYIPIIGDKRYAKFPNKKQLDLFRKAYYNKFGIDPNISHSGIESMFNDNLLDINGEAYYFKENIPFKMYIDSSNLDLERDQKASVLVSFSKDDFLSSKSDSSIDLINRFIKQYTNNPVNFILTNGDLANVSFAYISDEEFYHFDGKKYYSDFFSELFDNLYRNIIYIGESMTKDVSVEEIKKVEDGLVVPYQLKIAKENNISLEELKGMNHLIKRKILK